MKLEKILSLLPANTASQLKKWISENELSDHSFEGWFSNFPNSSDKDLAARLLVNFTYFSEKNFKISLDNLGNSVRQRMSDNNDNFESAFFVYDSNVLDSSHPILYSASKSEYWPLSEKVSLSIKDLTKEKVKGSPIVILNDTQGSGNQFEKTIWPVLSKALSDDQNVYVACMVGTRQAKERFSRISSKIELVSLHSKGISLPELVQSRILTSDEAQRILALSARAYKKIPLGYGECQLLVAYHYQCPNNTLPLFWSNGEHEGGGKSWVRLFEYRKKILINNNFEKTTNNRDEIKRDSVQNKNEIDAARVIAPTKRQKKSLDAITQQRKILSPATASITIPMSVSTVHVSQLDFLFYKLIEQDGDVIESPISEIVKVIEHARIGSEPARLIGASGSGKMMIVSSLFSHFKNLGLKPIYLDFSRYQPKDMLEFVKATINNNKNKKNGLIVIQYEPPNGSGSIPRDLVECISGIPSLIASSVSDITINAFRIKDCTADSLTSAGKYLQLAALKRGISYSDSKLSLKNSEDFSTLCNQQRCSPDLFLASQFLDAMATGEKPKSVSDLVDLYISRALDERSSEVGKEIKRIARYAYAVYTESGRKGGRQSEETLRYLSSRSGHIKNWLIAYGSLITLGDLCRDEKLKKTKQPRNHLDFVHSNSINSFIRSLIKGNKFTINSEFWEWILSLICDFDQGEVLLKANACYIVGRAANQARHKETIRALVSTRSSMTKFINAIDCAKLFAARMHSFDRNSRSYAREFFRNFRVSTDGDGKDIRARLERLESHALLCQRSAIISMAMLSDLDSAYSYIRQLMVSIKEDDLNRGFHLVYYGDLPYRPADPLISTDQEGVDCTSTINSLMKSIDEDDAPESLVAIQVYTLLSLIRNRNCCSGSMKARIKFTVSNEIANRAINLCKNYLDKTKKMPREIRSGMNLIIRQIEWGDFVVESVIDDMYGMKELFRTGWENTLPREPLTSHTYFVRILSGLLVRDNDYTSANNGNSPVDLALYHDVGESIMGDIPIHKKMPHHTENEQNIVSVISSIGAITGSSEALRIQCCFTEFEQSSGRTDAARIAKDMDKLDLLIQFQRYKRMNVNLPREIEFRAYIDPSNFESPEGQFWAARFQDYFRSLASQRPDRTMWPVNPAEAKNI